jgi:hypothetical protein
MQAPALESIRLLGHLPCLQTISLPQAWVPLVKQAQKEGLFPCLQTITRF